jgi:hypothetical protein
MVPYIFRLRRASIADLRLHAKGKRLKDRGSERFETYGFICRFCDKVWRCRAGCRTWHG